MKIKRQEFALSTNGFYPNDAIEAIIPVDGLDALEFAHFTWFRGEDRHAMLTRKASPIKLAFHLIWCAQEAATLLGSPQGLTTLLDDASRSLQNGTPIIEKPPVLSPPRFCSAFEVFEAVRCALEKDEQAFFHAGLAFAFASSRERTTHFDMLDREALAEFQNRACLDLVGRILS